MTPLRQAGIRHLTDGLGAELEAWRRPTDGEGLAGSPPLGASLAHDDDARPAIALLAAGSALLDRPTEPR